MIAAFADAKRGVFTPEVQDRCKTVKCNGECTKRHYLYGFGWSRPLQMVWQPPRSGSRSVRHCLSSRPVDTEALLEMGRGHWRMPSGPGNGLHRTLDVQFRKTMAACAGDMPRVSPDKPLCTGCARFNSNSGLDGSIGLLRSRIGHHPWILASALP